MLVAAIISGCLSLLCFVVGIIRHFSSNSEIDDGVIAAFFGVIFGFIWFIFFLTCLNWQISSKELTGYIYSSSARGGYTHAHIRYSQNAGTDIQPEFCVKTDSGVGRTVQKYVGSSTKVSVNIPSYFYLANNPFACGTTNMIIKEMK